MVFTGSDVNGILTISRMAVPHSALNIIGFYYLDFRYQKYILAAVRKAVSAYYARLPILAGLLEDLDRIV